MSSATGFASLRLQQVKPSASVVVSQTARKLRAEGKDIIDLGIGEPDFNTPEHIVEAAHQAALTGKTRYTPMAGTVELKQAICDKFKRDNKLDFTAEQVFTSNGAKQVIFSALMATLNPGDEVLLCAPYFGCYRDAVLSIGATPIALPCHAKDNFRLTPATLQAAITDKTRWLLLNLPSNPAGAFLCVIIGIPLGIWFGKSKRAYAIAEPVLDFMQTMPAFVYLIPIIAFFGTGKPPGVLATLIFAMPPVIRLTALGMRGVPEATKEAAVAFGCSKWQLLRNVEIPLAMPSIMTGINQTILMSLSMVVIASLIGAEGLGALILEALQYAAKGQGLLGGLAILLCAMVIDRIAQGMYRKKVGTD